MGSNPDILAVVAEAMAAKGAPRIDLNCGCPANVVTGKGAGSSMLRTPDLVHDCIRAMVAAASGRAPVTVKMRSGFADTGEFFCQEGAGFFQTGAREQRPRSPAGLFEANVAAAEAAGASFLTLHPRTKVQTYQGRADWSLIRRAREVARVPVIGNGEARGSPQQPGSGTREKRKAMPLCCQVT